MRKTIPLLATAVLLGACASQQTKDPASRYFDPPIGSEVVVLQAIDIAAGFAHAVIQDGKAVPPSALRRYEPFCEIEVNDVLERSQQVRPDRFAITRVVRQQQQVGLTRPARYATAEEPVQLAGAGIGIGIGSGGGFGWSLGVGIPIGTSERDGGPLVFNLVSMRLKSAAQPNVRELRCSGGWASSSDVVYPTLAEMRAALGALAEIRLPPAAR